MPEQTQDAINWALTQKDVDGNEITKNTTHSLVDKVRDYFNSNNINYNSFSYDDLIPYLI
ncbi:MAG: hypothetical protein LLF98_01995 [Clostridium sp.]|uniref:hypothetical protein n=1 Tax=Clostridium sp. TaxID=1506 RepID=UPI0025BB8084|nr:hypothetical protein [Clostridium sp.]MCE5220053.1 hypothetical protein [Clostridium sp.]